MRRSVIGFGGSMFKCARKCCSVYLCGASMQQPPLNYCSFLATASVVAVAMAAGDSAPQHKNMNIYPIVPTATMVIP